MRTMERELGMDGDGGKARPYFQKPKKEISKEQGYKS